MGSPRQETGGRPGITLMEDAQIEPERSAVRPAPPPADAPTCVPLQVARVVVLALVAVEAVLLALALSRGDDTVALRHGPGLVLSVVALLALARTAGPRPRGREGARCRAIVTKAPDVITIVSEDGTITWASPSCAELFGQPPESLAGRDLADLVEPEDSHDVRVFVGSVARDAGPGRRAEWGVQHRDGGVRHVEALAVDLSHDPAVAGIALTMRDITARKDLEAQLERRAFRDSLTGLTNRARFLDRLEHAMERRKRTGLPLCVIYVDVDDLKAVNDGLGHAAGDALLLAVAEVLRSTTRSSDTTGRLGGDEFAVILEDLDDPAQAEAVAERLAGALRLPVHMGGGERIITASVGFALADENTPADDLLRAADAAMYAAKAARDGRPVRASTITPVAGARAARQGDSRSPGR